MADDTSNTTPANPAGPAGTGTLGADDQVRFRADPALESDTGAEGSAINFEASDDMGETKRTAGQTLKDEASRIGGQAADQARAFAGQGKDRAVSALDEFAAMFRSAADEVDARLGAEYGRYARSAADGIANFAENLREKEVDALIDDASDLVRKSPAIAVGTAAALGFVLARVVKSGIEAASSAGEPAAAADTPADPDAPAAPGV